MKGFIEVTNMLMDERVLVNIHWIEEVINNTIYISYTDGEEQDYIKCEESYDEIVAKIKEAV